MIQSSKVLWGEGLFLRPQHFQRQDAYHEWRLAEATRTLHPYIWGTRRCAIDTDGLASGILRLTELQLMLPDGDVFNAPGEDPLPDALNLSDVPQQMTEVVFHAAMAPVRSSGGNSPSGDVKVDQSKRFQHSAATTVDLFTQAATAELTYLHRTLKLVADYEPRDHLVTTPILKLRRNAAGTFDLDTKFIAPSLHIKSAPALMNMLKRLIDMLQAKCDALYGFHREPTRNVIEFRSGDIASFWLLHTASTACASLRHYLQHPGLHPERLYEKMLELTGSLLTFSKGYTLADLPAYQHQSPNESFYELEVIIRELLETVISTRYFAIALSETKPTFHVGRLDSGNIQPSTAFYVGVSASMPGAELIEAVPVRFKVGAPDDVDKLVLSAMGGVRLTHLAQVPGAIPVRPGAYYFALEPRGALYERMLQSQAITIYAPSGIQDLKLELLALNN